MTTAIPEDRRHHSRIAFHTSAHLVFGSQRIEVEVLDLSLKGALIQMPDATADLAAIADQTCQFNVSLDDTESDQIRMEARVAHNHLNRIGLLCQQIDLDSVTHLRRLVELNLGDPSLLERELSALIAE
ncbi:MAG: PilZ domain-containing protein [Propionivibrio sp.]